MRSPASWSLCGSQACSFDDMMNEKAGETENRMNGMKPDLLEDS